MTGDIVLYGIVGCKHKVQYITGGTHCQFWQNGNCNRQVCASQCDYLIKYYLFSNNKTLYACTTVYSCRIQPGHIRYCDLVIIEVLYCKRPIQCLASFKLLTPPPSPPGECLPLAFGAGGSTHSLGREGVGGQYLGRRQTLL